MLSVSGYLSYLKQVCPGGSSISQCTFELYIRFLPKWRVDHYRFRGQCSLCRCELFTLDQGPWYLSDGNFELREADSYNCWAEFDLDLRDHLQYSSKCLPASATLAPKQWDWRNLIWGKAATFMHIQFWPLACKCLRLQVAAQYQAQSMPSGNQRQTCHGPFYRIVSWFVP